MFMENMKKIDYEMQTLALQNTIFKFVLPVNKNHTDRTIFFPNITISNPSTGETISENRKSFSSYESNNCFD